MRQVVRPRLRRGQPAPPRILPEALAFQNELEALVAEPAPLVLRLWPLLAPLLLAALVAAAALLHLDIVVTGQGRLLPDAPPVVLQPMERAVLRELRVRPGEVVREGQVLAVLDGTFTEADREALDSQRRSLAAQHARLLAEQAGGDLPPAEGQDAGLQSLLLVQRQAFRVARGRMLDAELRAVQAALETERAAAAAAAGQLGIAEEVERMRATLMEGQVGSRLNLLAARAARMQVEQEQRRHLDQLGELGHRVAARRAERDAFAEDWRRQLTEDLVRVRGDLARVEEQLAKAQRLNALTLLRAPRDSVVLELAKRSPGSLVREGEPVVVLVPSDVPLIAEVTLRSADVGRLRPGDRAVLKVDAFPWRLHGMLDGRLRAVSRESYASGEGHDAVALHRGQIELGAAGLAQLPVGTGLIPGMTLVAEIKVGTRSVLGFFLEPLLRGLQESLREP